MGNRLALPVAEMAARYAAGESTYGLGQAYGVGRTTIWRRLAAAGVKMRLRGGPRGNTHGLGGKSRLGLHKRGGPLHADRESYLRSYDREGRNCRIHRACWEAYHGSIPAGHAVHHIDGDVQNNEIENLVCMPHGEHTRQHRRRSIANARG